MKNFLKLSIILLFMSCSKETKKTESNLDKIVGIWVPFEIKQSDGTISSGPFTANTIIGIYAESIKIDSNGKYFPVIWNNINDYLIKTEEIGDFEFTTINKKIILKNGPIDLELDFKELNPNELVLLYSSGDRYRFKRELAY